MTLFGIHIVNWLLTVVTLGIYSFWAKVKVRAYLFAQTELANDRFAFHGTGKELFLGWLKFLLIVVPLLLLLVGFMAVAPHELKPLGIVFFYLIGFAMVPLLLWGSRRYQMSRTSWRGIRFSFRGSLSECYEVFLLGGLLTLLTLGLYYPCWGVAQREYWTRNTYFGNSRFSYRGDRGEMFKMYLRFWLCTAGGALAFGVLVMFVGPMIVMALGKFGAILMAILVMLVAYVGFPLLGVWWRATEVRYHWDHTAFQGIPFVSSLSGIDLMLRYLLYGVALVFTLGLAFAWVQADRIRFMCERLRMTTTPDFALVEQELRGSVEDAVAEGAIDTTDLSPGLDLGIG